MKWTTFGLLALAALSSGNVSAATFPATKIVEEGDPVPGLSNEIISILYPATVDSLGTITYTGKTTNGTSFVVTDGALAWSSSTDSIQSAASTALAGEWLARVQVGSAISEYSDLGPVVQTGDFVGAYRVTQLGKGRRVRADGTGHMLAEVRIPGQPFFGVALKSTTRAPGDVEFEISPTDTFDGSPLTNIGVQSQAFNDTFEAYGIQVDNPRRGTLVVNGDVLAVQGDSIPGQGGAWWGGDFRGVSVNNRYVVFINSNTEGDAIFRSAIGHWDGGTIVAQAAPKQSFAAGDCLVVGNQGPGCTTQIDAATQFGARVAPGLVNEVAFVGINSLGHPTNPGDEFLFYSCNAGDISGTPATLLLSRFDFVDLDGDGTGDAVLDRIGFGHPNGTGLTVSDTSILVPVELRFGGQLKQVIVSVPRPGCLSTGPA